MSSPSAYVKHTGFERIGRKLYMRYPERVFNELEMSELVWTALLATFIYIFEVSWECPVIFVNVAVVLSESITEVD